MKSSSKGFLMAVLLMFNVSLLYSSAFAFWPTTILVTDVAGQKQKLLNSDITHSKESKSCISGLEILISSSPRKCIWVEYTQVKLATFMRYKDVFRISVILDNGETLSGIFQDRNMKISGKSDLGEANYELTQIKSLEFLEFKEYRYSDSKPVSRTEAASLWRKERQQPSREWVILDGSKNIIANGFELMDSFNTNVDGIFIYFGKILRRCSLCQDILVKHGASNTKVSLSELQSIEITGKQVQDKPEIIIVKADGAKFALSMLMKTGEEGFVSSSKITDSYGGFEEDDMLVWETPYGEEGLSLLPPRTILLKKTTSSNKEKLNTKRK